MSWGGAGDEPLGPKECTEIWGVAGGAEAARGGVVPPSFPRCASALESRQDGSGLSPPCPLMETLFPSASKTAGAAPENSV